MKSWISLVVVLFVVPTLAAASSPLVVHEWGTFTSLQDEAGRSIGGVNSSSEPLPPFVHRLRQGLIVNDGIDFSKGSGVARAHPDVTMRLETPVIYFHPAKDAAAMTLDVTATFKGGVLSEFYPYARFHFEGGTPAPAGTDRITDHTAVSLTWKDVHIGGEVTLPKTEQHVWLAPREVASAPVSIGRESEQYVFYRGLGHVEAPLQVIRVGDSIVIHDRSFSPGQPLAWGPVWLAEFRPDGTCAFRKMTAGPGTADRAHAEPAQFADSDFSKPRLADLREEMRKALMADGLFPDEAQAMLNTWQQSYFQDIGQRLFFLVPRAWTDHVLPLKISVPNDLTRVMMGRIELVTPSQRDALRQMATAKPPTGAAADKLLQGLGRFGYALVLDEMRQRPSESLGNFAKTHGIQAFAPTTQPVRVSAATPTALRN